MSDALPAPFPWFGGKSRVAHVVWNRFGADIPNYVEPFFGSGAVLLGRPGGAGGIETVNDLDGFVCNFWRAVAAAPEETARWADWPVNENDLHARHAWLRERRADLARRIEADPTYCDPQIAGWWVWGIACWIGSGWCDPNTTGPWIVVDGKLVRSTSGRGVSRSLVHLGTSQGVSRKRVHLGAWFGALSERLRRVRVCCGDWERILGPSPTTNLGLTAVFLDPPYDLAERGANIYAEDAHGLSARVREWAIAHGDDPLLRIALCGYEGEHEIPASWERVEWRASGGYSKMGHGQGEFNRHRERIWFSPHCLRAAQGALFPE